MTEIPTPVDFIGAPGSPYTRKMRALLRYRGIPYRMIQQGGAADHDLPKPKVGLLPTFFLPDDSGELAAVTDSTPLLRRFEAAFSVRAAVPPDPALAFLDALLEDYGDEWLTKPMFHYRWAYEADIEKAKHVLPLWRAVDTPDAQVDPLRKMFSERQISRLYVVGSNETTAPVIEASYVRFLRLFDAHLSAHPYVLGRRPGAADFAWFGQLTQLAQFDPTPAAVTLAESPRVYAWVDVVEDLSGIEVSDDDWLSRSDIGVLRPFFEEMGRTYVPVMRANAQALQEGNDTVRCEVEGLPWEQQPFPYQAKCLVWLRRDYEALSAADQSVVDGALAGTGCEALFA
ncbi:MAG: glutathione S-transferase family protein [Myxococcota bacterium]